MTSMLVQLLLRPTMPKLSAGRLVRFGTTTSSALTKGPLAERVMCCLKGATTPMRLADISEAILDYDSRVKKILAKLVRQGSVEAIGPEGFGQRFRLR